MLRMNFGKYGTRGRHLKIRLRKIGREKSTEALGDYYGHIEER